LGRSTLCRSRTSSSTRSSRRHSGRAATGSTSAGSARPRSGAPTKRSSDCWFLYTEHYRAQAEPSIHATAIKARGEWVPGVIDPASRGRSQTDGHALLDIYLQLGLKVVPADNRVTGEEGGLYAVWERLSTGRLKVFRTLQNWQREYRLYRRDEKGKVVKKDDHLMDATRYLVMSGREHAITQPVAKQFTGPGSAAGGDRRAGY
jgi:hypothetical protein